MLGTQAEADEPNVRLFSRGNRTNFLDVDLASDHVMAQPRDDLRKQLKPLALLVRDQDA